MRRQHLVDLLENHQPHTEEEAGYRERMLSLVRAKGDAFSRSHYDPGHFTCSSFVLSPDREALLLIAHSKLKRWLQPGGHTEPTDADVFAAARREVAEETGITELELVDGLCLFDLDIHAIPPLGDSPPHEHFDLRFLFVAENYSFQAGSDASDARWVPLDQVSSHESDQSVMRAVSKLRERYQL